VSYLAMIIIGVWGASSGNLRRGVHDPAPQGPYRPDGEADAAYPGAAGLAIAMEQGVFGLIIILFLIFEPDGLAHRWKMIKAYWKLYPFSY